MKKITDKQRLDWLTKNCSEFKISFEFNCFHPGWICKRIVKTNAYEPPQEIDQDDVYKTPRQAIDAAMKAEAKHEEK